MVLEYLFYGMSLLFILWEIKKFVEPHKVVDFKNKFKESGFVEFDEMDFSNNYHKNLFKFSLFHAVYLLWTLIGLFLNQWLIFLTLFLLRFFSDCETVSSTRVDAILKMGLLIFLILNKFHLVIV